jgi:protein-S-isoprenylcysteine O-methyltransferase Ste14
MYLKGAAMPIPLFSLVQDGWFALGVLFLITATWRKPEAFQEPVETELPRNAGIAAGFGLIFMQSLPIGSLNGVWLSPSLWARVPAVALCVAGWALTIWARLLLGSNWSAAVMLKRGHTLVQKGPYAVVRHPIYSGMLVALLGTALIDGHIRSALGFILLVAMLKLKAEKEERLMRYAFGPAYDCYCRTTGALVPRLR